MRKTVVMKNIIIVLLLLSASLLNAQQMPGKFSQSSKSSFHAIPYDSVIINIGSLKNFVANNTKNFSTDDDPHSFRIGRDDLRYPSMSWIEGGYPDNHYLSSGTFFVGIDSTTVLFNRKTSTDFKVQNNTSDIPSHIMVSYSMTDDSAGLQLERIRTVCRVYAWTDFWRDDFFIYEYLIINEGSEPLEDIYAGLLMDFDISAAGGLVAGMPYWSDDRVGYLLSRGVNQIPESISFMYDGNDLNTPENDMGGYYIPKESLGYVGSRILNSPQTKRGVPANQQSGHQWYSQQEMPNRGSEYYRKMADEKFMLAPQIVDDYQYLQSAGPWDMQPGDTLHVAFGLGIGEGIFSLVENLQTAYDLYWQLLRDKHRPQIYNIIPNQEVVPIYTGDVQTFHISANDLSGDSLIYLWRLDEQLTDVKDTIFTYESTKYSKGVHSLKVEVSDKKAAVDHEWIIVQEAPRIYSLGQNYPNPFNSGTTIPFELTEPSNVTITIYNIAGGKIATLIREFLNAGQWVVLWDGRDIQGKKVASGIYYYHLLSEHFSDVKQMLLLK